MSTLVESASDTTLAVLYYSKSVSGKKSPEPRLVEPYSFSTGKQDLLITCWQLQRGEDASECGWRYFMAHKIQRVEKTTLRYKPRRKITMPEGTVDRTFVPNPHWDVPGRKEYRDCLCDVLADGVLSPNDQFDADAIRSRYKLTTDDLRFVHATLYHRCLGAVIEDGVVGADEVQQIRFLHNALWTLGWSIGD